MTHCARRALASLSVFEALHAAVATTGVHVRRVHYLYRDATTAPTEVSSSSEQQRCHCATPLTRVVPAQPPAWSRAVYDFRRGGACASALACARLRQRALRGEHVPPEAGPGFSTCYSYVAPVVRHCGPSPPGAPPPPEARAACRR